MNDERISFRLKKRTKDNLEKAAKKNKRKVSDMARLTLEEAFDKKQERE